MLPLPTIIINIPPLVGNRQRNGPNTACTYCSHPPIKQFDINEEGIKEEDIEQEEIKEKVDMNLQYKFNEPIFYNDVNLYDSSLSPVSDESMNHVFFYWRKVFGQK
jgi:hypothetical protein